MMKTLVFLLLTACAFAQSPIGTLRLRLGNANSNHYNRIGIDTGSGMWDFSAASGGSIPALKGDAGSLTVSSATSAPHGLTFNGSTAFVYVNGDIAQVQPTSTFTVTTLTKVTTQQDVTFWSKWDSSAGHGTLAAACGQGGSSKKCECYISQSDSTNVIATDPNDSYVVGTYFVHTCVADGSRIRNYVNGNEVASTAYNGTLLDEGSYMLLGSLNNAAWFLNGVIDFADYRKRAMSASEVKQSYRGLRQSYCTTFGGAYCTDLPK
jgi:hypothetical protein